MPDQNFQPSDASAKLGTTNPSVTTPVEPVPLIPPDNLSQAPPPLETPVIPGPLITEEVSTSSLPAGGSDIPPTPPIVEPAPDGGFPEEPSQGSAAPSGDIVSPIIDGAPKKKSAGKKMIATILGLLILVGGLGAGVILVKQQQDIRERAATACKTDADCKSGYVCSDKGACVLNATAKPTETKAPTKTPTETKAPTATATPAQNACEKAGGLCYETSVVKADCSNIGKPINGGVGCSSLSQVCCAKAGEPTKTPTPTCAGNEYCAQGQICVNGVCIAGTPTPTSSISCVNAPTTSGQCKHTDGTTASFTGNCVIYYCPNGLGSNGKCGVEDTGVWWKFGSCSSLWNSLGVNQCGQIDTVDTNNAYCIPTGQCNSKIVNNSSCSATPTQPGGPTVTSTVAPEATAQCLNIRAFNTSWIELSSTQLAALKAGDIVRFTVAGTATSGSFDMARFKINGVQRADVTQKRPGTQEFYDEYVIPSGVTTFTINAQIHHTTLGWSN
jgi:hypothetical protein